MKYERSEFYHLANQKKKTINMLSSRCFWDFWTLWYIYRNIICKGVWGLKKIL